MASLETAEIRSSKRGKQGGAGAVGITPSQATPLDSNQQPSVNTECSANWIQGPTPRATYLSSPVSLRRIPFSPLIA